MLLKNFDESEKLAREVIKRTDNPTYGFIMRFIITCSCYLSNKMNKGRTAALDLLKYSELLPVGYHIFWIFESLENFIKYDSNINSNLKEMLLLLLHLPESKTIENKNSSQSKIQTFFM